MRADTAARGTRIRIVIADTGALTTGVALAILFLLPLLWAGYSSLSGPRATGDGAGLGTENYQRLFSYGEGLFVYVANSVAVSLMTVAGTVVVSVLAGYAIARFRFPGRNLLFLGTLAIMMVPYPTILIPLYVLLSRAGLQNSLVGLALVLIMFQLPFSLFMMRNSFEAVPREFDEAALVDGAGVPRTLWSVLLPAVTPGVITVALFAFLNSWNEFIAPLMLVTDGSRYTLPVALAAMRSGNFGAVDFGALQSGVVVSAVPCMILFVLLQRHYVRGFASGALKG
ncbi:multiple sugar transport system permease protein [Actinoalloteichus hoggarensis]|uniref:Trehalose transport system permease protein SugB n=1 Tax=Actinoalloteichus hoggarensis TaxID=1470176 RepID=A0A221W4Z5_9PSEU|nr:carbohydrate ABC transporter permease [Actinoalloteichus hoggarensis]ASO20793.1 Trehalose transport system permease protein SugB [Actinoalloteichus hoggarensis]MBB5920723.1 multiple sugar transport system permease protein [Actinoalloteichus hoggarensis]